MKINTTCKDCFFRKNNESGEQIGCEFKRLEKFKEKNKAFKENSYYVIDGLCNSCRDTPIYQDNVELEVERVREEIKTPFYVFINCTEGYNFPETIIESLKDSKYNNIFAHFIFDSGSFVDTYKKIEAQVDCDFKFKVSKVPDEESINFIVSDTVNSLKANYFVCYSDHDSNIDRNSFDQIDSLLNDDLSPLACYIDEGMVVFNKKILSMMFKEATSVLDVEFYVQRVMAWAKSQDKENLIWIKK